MTRFVSFKTPPKQGERGAGLPLVVNPDHVAMIEPIPTAEQPKCRLWFAFSPQDVSAPYRDVLGTLKEVGLRLQEPPASGTDPLGRHHPA